MKSHSEANYDHPELLANYTFYTFPQKYSSVFSFKLSQSIFLRTPDWKDSRFESNSRTLLSEHLTNLVNKKQTQQICNSSFEREKTLIRFFKAKIQVKGFGCGEISSRIINFFESENSQVESKISLA